MIDRIEAAPLCRCCGKPIPKRTITVQVFFCGGPCRNRFAYAMARAGHCTEAHYAAIRKIRERDIDAIYAARSTPSGDSHGNR